MPLNNDGLLVTPKLCTSRAGGLVDVIIYVASGALDTNERKPLYVLTDVCITRLSTCRLMQ